MKTNGELINYLVKGGILKTKLIIDTFRAVDRADFVRVENLSEAYEDYPLPIGHEATISQPTTVAFMLELLQPEAGDRVLDIGSGSGWTTALLARLVGAKGKVFGVEIMPELVEFGQSNLKKYPKLNAEIRLAGKELGLPEEAPFDKILVSAAGQEMPKELIQQLKSGGKLVIPVQNSVLEVTKDKDGQVSYRDHYGFAFVPLKE